MEISRVKEVLSSLADGIDPTTGEIFPPQSPYQNPEIIRALFSALQYIAAVPEKPVEKKSGPDHAGAPWTAEEEEVLLTAFNSGVPIKEIAVQSGRTKGAITSRLKKMGLLSY